MKTEQAIVQALIQEEVGVIFGIPGFPTIPVYDALYENPDIRHILVMHEQAASFMAYAYGMVTGKPGTCYVVDGPGATNIATGIADAYTGSIPMVAIIGKIHSGFSGRGAVHELDSSFFQPITKKIYRISEPREIAPSIRKAYATAATGRKGPVGLEIPLDILNKDIDERTDTPPYHENIPEASPADITAAGKQLLNTKKPLIIAGGGVLSADASAELTELAEFLGIPVAESNMGRGCIPNDHALSLGLIRNNPSLVKFIQESDVVLAVGFRFSQILTLNWTLKIPKNLIHIDVDPGQIGKNYPVEIGIAGDAKTELRSILDCIKSMTKKRSIDEYPRFKEVTEWKKLLSLKNVPYSTPIKPMTLIKELREALPRDAIIATDVGNSFFWALFFLEVYQQRSFISSSSFSAMGCGLPFAIGAKLAEPERPVVCLTGDGGFLMNCQELLTAGENRLGIPVVIMNDSGYGAIRHIQNRMYPGRNIASGWQSPDFTQIANGFGAGGIRIEQPDEIKPAIKKAFASDRPTILDVRIDGREKLPQNRLPGNP